MIIATRSQYKEKKIFQENSVKKPLAGQEQGESLKKRTQANK
jgi:hypothetical protein